jgi:enoyl-CoA hydratase/carnithine racemase
MADPLVLVESRPDGVTLLRLNRPPLNPLSTDLLRELELIATDLSADASV